MATGIRGISSLTIFCKIGVLKNSSVTWLIFESDWGVFSNILRQSFKCTSYGPVRYHHRSDKLPKFMGKVTSNSIFLAIGNTIRVARIITFEIQKKISVERPPWIFS